MAGGRHGACIFPQLEALCMSNMFVDVHSRCVCLCCLRRRRRRRGRRNRRAARQATPEAANRRRRRHRHRHRHPCFRSPAARPLPRPCRPHGRSGTGGAVGMARARVWTRQTVSAVRKGSPATRALMESMSRRTTNQRSHARGKRRGPRHDREAGKHAARAW